MFLLRTRTTSLVAVCVAAAVWLTAGCAASSGSSSPTDTSATTASSTTTTSTTTTSTTTTEPPTTTAQPELPESPEPKSYAAELSATYAQIDEIAAIWLPHLKWAISVQVIHTAATPATDTTIPAPGSPTAYAELPEPVSFNPDETFISASSAKPFWMTAVAAVHDQGTEALQDLADEVLCKSSNTASAEVIKLAAPTQPDSTAQPDDSNRISGIDRINEFLHTQADMTSTLLLRWTFGDDPPEPASPKWHAMSRYTSNRTTVQDAVKFYTQLYTGELLPAADTEVMLGWLAEHAKCNGQRAYPLALRLPEDVQIMHKAGWLPPGCCSSETATLNDFGVVATPQATYAIAIATQGGRIGNETYEQQENFIAYAACKVQATLTSEPLDCQRSEDTRVFDEPPVQPATTLAPAPSFPTLTFPPATTTSQPIPPAPPLPPDTTTSAS